MALAAQLGENEQIILAGKVDFADELPQNIISVGYISSAEELAQLYSACDVYVHLSREDTFGKVIAEALACGTPAIVYDATACPEVLGEECGYAVTPGDMEGILERIQQIKESGKGAFCTACAQYVRKHFEKEQLVEQTLRLYQSLAECGD